VGGWPRSWVYGEISTGAHNDLERPSDLVRDGDEVRHVRAGGLALATPADVLEEQWHAVERRGEYSEETARAIDAEVREILDRTHDRVRGILTAKKAVLVREPASSSEWKPSRRAPPSCAGGGIMETRA